MKEKIIVALKTKYQNLGFSEKVFNGVADYLFQTVTEEEQIETAVAGVENFLKSFQGEVDNVRTEKSKLQKELEELKEKTPTPPESKTEENKDETPEWFLEFKKEQEDKLRLIQESQTEKEKQEIISRYVSDLGIPQWRMKGVEVKGETEEEIKNFLLPIKQDLIDAGLSEKYNEGRQVHDKQKEAQEAKEFVDHMPDKN